jgi:hypothetical protein
VRSSKLPENIIQIQTSLSMPLFFWTIIRKMSMLLDKRPIILYLTRSCVRGKRLGPAWWNVLSSSYKGISVFAKRLKKDGTEGGFGAS